ncbi:MULTISPECIES: TrmH family RNA methyltransferase [Corynebacterium]|uniref:TrmH family RNA methyltransferase n=1 Tax=Corynebacterium TaxID=1716 RepID=UPI00084829D8|nr:MULTISPECIES: RNA methyltransferase [Corynebacterium]ODQ38958.1 rRNA methyltransferase [Corynebacterium amycolatum]OHR39041.1 rRNA methyltransferase [Corynebacterium sp. HMSC075F02]
MNSALYFNDEPFTPRTPRVSAAIQLHRAAKRKKTGRFLIEGFNSVDAAIRAEAVVEVFVTAAAAEQFRELLTGYLESGTQRKSVSLIDDSAARSLSETVTTTGLFAVCDTNAVSTSLEEAIEVGKQSGCLVIPVECNDPGNVGTIVRMTDALGAGAVILAGDSVDPLNSKAVRSSAGSVFHTPVARERDIDVVMEKVREAGFTTLATAMDGALTLGVDTLPDGPVAWLFGNEAHGLLEEITASAGANVSIPIKGEAESLNLATAAAMCLWETVRGK